MDVLPAIEISFSGGGAHDVRAPLRAIANTDAPMRVRRKEPVVTQIMHKDEMHELRIWSSRRRGSGTRGAVLEADMVSPSGRTELVTVRVFNSLLNEKSLRLLPQVVSAWQRVDHPHILPFYGLSAPFGLDQVAMVSAFAPNGNLKEFIIKNPAKDRQRLLTQVAEGLQYLHLTMEIVHGDLKCANVLISADESALLADFGLSTLFERTEMPSATSIRIRNMAPFAAPELFSDRSMRRAMQDLSATEKHQKTTMSDIFAFGGLIYEAYTCTEPRLVVRSGVNGEVPPRNSAAPLAVPLSDGMWDLCMRCWDRDPFRRPDCSEILNSLTCEGSTISRDNAYTAADAHLEQEMLDQTAQ